MGWAHDPTVSLCCEIGHGRGGGGRSWEKAREMTVLVPIMCKTATRNGFKMRSRCTEARSRRTARGIYLTRQHSRYAEPPEMGLTTSIARPDRVASPLRWSPVDSLCARTATARDSAVADSAAICGDGHAASTLPLPSRVPTPHVPDTREPAAAILRRAAPDTLVVMGAYGHSRLYRMVLGSTTEQVIHACGGPLLLSRK